MTVMGILAAITAGAFLGFVRIKDLAAGADTVTSVLDDARVRTLAATDDTRYGVHFASSSVTLFSGDTYAAGGAGNEVTTLSSGVAIASIALSDGGEEVLFKRLTGEVEQTGTIVVELAADPSQTKTILIEETGLIEVTG